MKKVINVIKWIIGIIFVISGVGIWSVSAMAGILLCLAGIVMLPVVTGKIPQFKHRNVILVTGYVFLIIAAMASIPEADPDGKEEETVWSSETEEKNQVQDVAQEENSEDSLQRSTIDEEELTEWITEKLSGEKEMEVTDKESAHWGSAAEEDFLPVWKKVVLEQVDAYQENYGKFVEHMEMACTLYENLYRTENQIQSIVQSVNEMSDCLAENNTLDKQYEFNIMEAKENFSISSFCITQRLEQSYSDNIIGSLKKEIDSYKAGESSDWVAYNVEYVSGSPIPGDICQIIHAESLNPFSRADVYEVAYFDTGKTTEISNSKGFVESVPVYQLIEDMEKFIEDSALYSNNMEACFRACESIKRELSPETEQDSGSSGDVEVQDSIEDVNELEEAEVSQAGNIVSLEDYISYGQTAEEMCDALLSAGVLMQETEYEFESIDGNLMISNTDLGGCRINIMYSDGKIYSVCGINPTMSLNEANQILLANGAVDATRPDDTVAWRYTIDGKYSLTMYGSYNDTIEISFSCFLEDLTSW